MGRYDDIINLSRPEPVRDPMSLYARGAQFAPFAALTGHDEALSETARITSEFREPGEEDLNRMSTTISFLMMRNRNTVVEITYFVPDKLKSGGSYKTVRGEIRRISECEGIIIFKDSTIICFDRITSLKIVDKKF